jgi:hypothetical protein
MKYFSQFSRFDLFFSREKDINWIFDLYLSLPDRAGSPERRSQNQNASIAESEGCFEWLRIV